jgi:hypothetical protein
MATNSVENVLAGAKKTLENANKFTASVEGNPTSHFGPKKPTTPSIPQTHAEPSYSLARELRAKSDNVNEYTNASKQ